MQRDLPEGSDSFGIILTPLNTHILSTARKYVNVDNGIKRWFL